MKIYDVTMTIHKDMQVYKNLPEKRPVFRIASDFETGSSHETKIEMNLHTGTHMDFPLHMIKDGKTSNQLNLKSLITMVKVFDLSHLEDAIHRDDLLDLDIQAHDFVLFKTRNSQEEIFNFEFIYIHESAAKYLAELNIKGVGVDGLGVERDQKDHPTHKILFKHDIVIIEGLRLEAVEEGSYMMYALPIKMLHVDALPLSVILVEI
ncbi:MAG: cyclase family protein [Acholeplasmataceae bacterium]|nr:cyclase family protein [Acholeplasmataceae bacterium]